MPATHEEIQQFSRFAAQRVQQGDQIPSLEECLRQWRAEQERDATVADLLAGHQDFEEGRTQPLDEAFEDVRQKLGWTK